jgi:hypothetical protein
MDGIFPDYNGHIGAAESNIYTYSCDLLSASFRYKPRLFIDGDKWCALYGENLQDGVAGFGDSPAEAYNDFDINWGKKLGRK